MSQHCTRYWCHLKIRILVTNNSDIVMQIKLVALGARSSISWKPTSMPSTLPDTSVINLTLLVNIIIVIGVANALWILSQTLIFKAPTDHSLNVKSTQSCHSTSRLNSIRLARSSLGIQQLWLREISRYRWALVTASTCNKWQQTCRIWSLLSVIGPAII